MLALSPETEKWVRDYADAEGVSVDDLMRRYFAPSPTALMHPTPQMDDKEPAAAPHPRDLFLAIRHCDLAEVERQLALGADPNWKNRADESALVYAAFARNPDVVRLLLAHGATDDGKMPFEEAVSIIAGRGLMQPRRKLSRFFSSRPPFL